MTAPQNNPDKKALVDFFTLLSVCHTVMPEYDPKTQKIKYQASSPDELALVEGAAAVGFKFVEKTSATIKINLPTGEAQVWEVLAEFPFDSTRKRMSLIVKRHGTEDFIIMTKGADSIMFPRLRIDRQSEVIVQQHLDKFAVDGLRTLVVGQKVLRSAFVQEFINKMERVKISGDSDKEEQLNVLYDECEKDLELIGCTAIEDKLQDGVPETIATLMDAGIRIWVLTGDKQVLIISLNNLLNIFFEKETAIEIAKSCKLIQPHMETIILSSDNIKEFMAKLDAKVLQYVKKSSFYLSLKFLLECHLRGTNPTIRSIKW